MMEELSPLVEGVDVREGAKLGDGHARPSCGRQGLGEDPGRAPVDPGEKLGMGRAQRNEPIAAVAGRAEPGLDRPRRRSRPGGPNGGEPGLIRTLLVSLSLFVQL